MAKAIEDAINALVYKGMQTTLRLMQPLPRQKH